MNENTSRDQDLNLSRKPNQSMGNPTTTGAGETSRSSDQDDIATSRGTSAAKENSGGGTTRPDRQNDRNNFKK